MKRVFTSATLAPCSSVPVVRKARLMKEKSRHSASRSAGSCFRVEITRSSVVRINKNRTAHITKRNSGIDLICRCTGLSVAANA
jgi:hypothetical protein